MRLREARGRDKRTDVIGHRDHKPALNTHENSDFSELRLRAETVLLAAVSSTTYRVSENARAVAEGTV